MYLVNLVGYKNMLKDLVVFGLAHVGAFVVLRDILETSGVRAIQDANGTTEETKANFAQAEGEYIVPTEKCSDSETINYLLFGDALAKYFVAQVKSGRLVKDMESLVNQVKLQLGLEPEKMVFQPGEAVITDNTDPNGDQIVELR